MRHRAAGKVVAQRHAGAVGSSLFFILASLLVFATHIIAEGSDNIVSIAAIAPPEAVDKCAGKAHGSAIPGQYVVLFQDDKVQSLDQGLRSVLPAFQQPAAAAAAPATAITTALAAGAAVPAGLQSASLPFDIVKLFGSSSSSSSSTTSSAAAGGTNSRPYSRRPKPLVGFVVKVGADAAGEAVVQRMKAVDTVKTVVNDVCVRSTQAGSPPPPSTFSCIPAPMLSGITKQLSEAAAAAWRNCSGSGTKLAWWGEKCGSSGYQIQWSGVYAFDATTGAVLPNCVKSRPQQAASWNDTLLWLGDCGVQPGAVPDMPTITCTDAFAASISSQEQADSMVKQGCIAFGAAIAQTLDAPHPVPGCGQPMLSMVYTGELCSSGSSAMGIRWLSAAPAPGSTADATKCTIKRSANPATASDFLYNKDWFGGCGAPPARVQFLALPVDTSGSQTVPTGMARIMAVTTSAATGQLQTVAPVFPAAVAVIDSGIQCSHPDLNVVYTKQFNDERSPDPNRDGGCYDGLGHGTHVTGTIGALNNGYGVLGVLPGAPIVGLKVLNAAGSGEASSIIAALSWLLETSLNGSIPNPGGVTNAQQLSVGVVNLSLAFGVSSGSRALADAVCELLGRLENEAGVVSVSAAGLMQGLGWCQWGRWAGCVSSGSRALADAVCELLARLEAEAGVVSVSAAGNEGQPLNYRCPAGCPSTVTVTALDQQQGQVDPSQAPASFSNYLWLAQNPADAMWPLTPDKINRTVAAPGIAVNSTCPITLYNPSGYCSESGTSQATPHIAGIFARCYASGACRKSLGSQNVAAALQEFAVYNAENPGYGFSADTAHAAAGSVYHYGWLGWADAY
ncbi:hypothetical protein OEZ85_009945 [Tetradesmus obliquus]|uniref:Peptidase S8/S53 domain-containing protein n=1 Tax=Tetradesmus obliquus TaxID=3088 RepID=A0ABY8UAJ8_TETOB|nr:hypothetical protein OEZ85_009945 [Tetradesmus obliquus]